MLAATSIVAIAIARIVDWAIGACSAAHKSDRGKAAAMPQVVSE